MVKNRIIIKFPVWLRNLLIYGGLEPVLSHSEKNIVLQTILRRRGLSPGPTKLEIIFHFLSAESCVKYDAINKNYIFIEILLFFFKLFLKKFGLP